MCTCKGVVLTRKLKIFTHAHTQTHTQADVKTQFRANYPLKNSK